MKKECRQSPQVNKSNLIPHEPRVIVTPCTCWNTSNINQKETVGAGELITQASTPPSSRTLLLVKTPTADLINHSRTCEQVLLCCFQLHHLLWRTTFPEFLSAPAYSWLVSFLQLSSSPLTLFTKVALFLNYNMCVVCTGEQRWWSICVTLCVVAVKVVACSPIHQLAYEVPAPRLHLN